MLSNRVALFLVVFSAVMFCKLIPPFAVAQSIPRGSYGSQTATAGFSALAKAQRGQFQREPGTPAEKVLKVSQGRPHKLHPIATQATSPLSPIFLSALDYASAGQGTHSVAAADLNGDSKTDLVLADPCNDSNCSNGSVSVLLGNGDGTFQPAVSYNAGGQNTVAVALGDINGDGKVDVVVASNCDSNGDCSNGSVAVLLGNGDGTLQTAATYASEGEYPQYAVVADVNGDGKPDLLVANACASSIDCTNGSVSVLLGNGDGTFQSAGDFSSGGEAAKSVAVADLNSDGKQDLLVANACSSTNDCTNGSVSVLLGNGDGTFQSALSYSSAGQSAVSVGAADINGDGKLDAVVANMCGSGGDCSSGVVSTLLGNGDGTFQPALSYNSGGTSAVSVAVADINGDQKADVLVANYYDRKGNWMDGSVASVLLSNGDGTLQPAISYASGSFGASSVIVTDINGDGKPDVLLANECIDPNTCMTGAVSALLGNGDGTLRGGVNYNSGAWFSYSVAIADVNGDGKLDVLLANACNDNNTCSRGAASVLLGNGDGTFQTGVSYDTGAQDAFFVVAADVNGDGKLDLLVGNECAVSDCSNGSASVLLGNGDGTFQTPVIYNSGGLYTFSLAVADVNGDGKPDLLVGNLCADGTCSNGSVGVLLGNGDGTFQTPVTFSSGGLYTFSLAVADVNGDGKPDLLVANECADNNCSNGVTGVLLGNGDGSFHTPVDYSSGGLYTLAIAIGDVNGDGKPDLVVANECGSNNDCSTGSIGILLGQGDGTFQPASTTVAPTLANNQSIVLADFNGDQKLDVASGAGNVILLGNGDGTFQSPIALGANGPGIAVGDFNRDGRPDLAVGGVIVLLNVSKGFVFSTTTTLVSSANPSILGESVSFTATVAAQVTGTPTGTITFTDGTTSLGQSTLTGGTASLIVSSLSVGSHSIIASYYGDSNFTGSVSVIESQIVQKADTTTTLDAVPRTANLNQNITLTATVTSGSSGTPTGTVTFLDGTSPIGSLSLSGGLASLSTSALAAGTHNVTAQYGGDTNFNGSASSITSVVVTSSAFSLSASTLSPASVLPGGAARSKITITPVVEFNPSNINLSCNISPAVDPALVCSLSAISVTRGVGSSTLTVVTTGRAVALIRQPTDRGFAKLALLTLLLPALFLCGRATGKCGRRKFIVIGFTCLVFVSCILQTACGGYRTSGGGPETPAGTYTVTVRASGSGMQQTTSLALVVQ
jgi:hypothetical protein